MLDIAPLSAEDDLLLEIADLIDGLDDAIRAAARDLARPAAHAAALADLETLHEALDGVLETLRALVAVHGAARETAALARLA